MIRLSGVLEALRSDTPTDELGRSRTWNLQIVGNELCRTARREDALAFAAIDQIRKARVESHAAAPAEATQIPGTFGSLAAPQTAYLVWSLKRPAEVATLRSIYRSRLFVISVHTPFATRLDRLIGQEADAAGHVTAEESDRDDAIRLLERDEREKRIAIDADKKIVISQNVSDTYPLADFFVDATSRESIGETLERAINVIFGDPFATPSRAEYGMFLAHAAALKSAELSRQVGSAILTPTGDVVATGTNEVPKPGGGHYWSGDKPDRREFTQGVDTSVRLRRRLINHVVDAIEESVASVESSAEQPPAKLDTTLLPDRLGQTRLGDLIEFGRPVHAEMAALIDAARLGSAVRGCVMYVTTFPCHLCTRLIVAAGIARIEYIYPYPKSLSDDLYDRLIDTGKGRPLDPNAIPFAPFIEVAPRRYQMAFTAPDLRKEVTGKAIRRPARSPRLLIEDEIGEWDLSTHIVREGEALNRATWLKDVFEQVAEEKANGK